MNTGIAAAAFAETLSHTESAQARRRTLRETNLAPDDVRRLLEDARTLRVKSPLRALRVARCALTAARILRQPALVTEAHRLVGQCAFVLGQARTALHHLRAAERTADAALRARLVPEICGALGLLGRVEEALVILAFARQNADGPDSERARAILDLCEGNLLLRFDRNEEALVRLNRARRVFHRRGETAAVAGADSNRANALGNLQRYGVADRLYRKSAVHYRAAGQHGVARQVEYNHAYLFFLRGDFEEALTRFHALRAQFAVAGDEYHVALCDMDEAEIDLRLNLVTQAVVHAERAALALTRLGVGQDAARARFFHALALGRQRRSKESADELLPVMKAFQEQGCPAWEAICLQRLAEIDLGAGERVRARERASRAAARLHELGLFDRAANAEILVAEIDVQSGDPEAAQKRLLALEQRARGLYAPWLSCELHHKLGRIHAVLGRARPAVKHLLRATRILARHRATAPPDERMNAFLKDKAAVYEDAVFFLLWLGGRRARRLALELAEQARGRALLEIMGTRIPAPEEPVSASLCREADALGGEIDGLLGRMPDPSPALAADRAHRSSEAARSRQERLESCLAEIAAVDPAAARLRTVSTTAWDDAARALDADTTLVEYFVGASELLAFVATNQGVAVERVGVGREDVRRLVARMRFQLERPALARGSDTVATDAQARAATEVLGELHDLLLAPLLPGITGRRLVVVPHGELFGVPFAALGRGGRALLDDRDVLTVPSTSAYLRALAAPRPGRGGPVLLGVPDAEAPGLGREVERLGAGLPGARVFVGPAAVRDVLERQSAGAPVVHVAAHAEFRCDDPLLSSLRLGDGWLTVADIYRLRLPPAVVVLSGCATGGSPGNESADLFGLLGALLHAGAASVLSSLWRTSDAAQLEFLERFHAELRRTDSPAAASRAAAQEVRGRHPHPCFWASFVLSGRA